MSDIVKKIIENASSPSAIAELVEGELSVRLGLLSGGDAPTAKVDEGLEKIHISPRKNPQGDEIFWDGSEGKYYNKSSDTYLDLKELKKFGLMESYEDEKSRDLVAEASLDLVDNIAEGHISKATDLIHGIMEQRLIEMSEPVDPDEVCEAKIITKVNSKGEKRRRLKCRPGYILKNGVCMPVSGDKKVNKMRGAKKAARTKHAQGAGYALKVAKKAKKAKLKRKAFGLKEEYTSLVD